MRLWSFFGMAGSPSPTRTFACFLDTSSACRNCKLIMEPLPPLPVLQSPSLRPESNLSVCSVVPLYVHWKKTEDAQMISRFCNSSGEVLRRRNAGNSWTWHLSVCRSIGCRDSTAWKLAPLVDGVWSCDTPREYWGPCSWALHLTSLCHLVKLASQVMRLGSILELRTYHWRKSESSPLVSATAIVWPQNLAELQPAQLASHTYCPLALLLGFRRKWHHHPWVFLSLPVADVSLFSTYLPSSTFLGQQCLDCPNTWISTKPSSSCIRSCFWLRGTAHLTTTTFSQWILLNETVKVRNHLCALFQGEFWPFVSCGR